MYAEKHLWGGQREFDRNKELKACVALQNWCKKTSHTSICCESLRRRFIFNYQYINIYQYIEQLFSIINTLIYINILSIDIYQYIVLTEKLSN